MESTLTVLFNIEDSPITSRELSTSISSQSDNNNLIQKSSHTDDFNNIKEELANIQINQTLLLEKLSEIDTKLESIDTRINNLGKAILGTKHSSMAQGQAKHPLTGLFDPKFDIALNLTHTGLFQHKVRTCFEDMEKTIELRRLLPHCPRSAISTAEIGVSIISKIFGLAYSLHESVYISQLKEYLELSQMALAIQEEHLFSNSSEILRDHYLQQVKDLRDLKKPIHIFLQQHWCLKRSMDKIIDRLQLLRETPLRPDNVNSGKIRIDGTNCTFVLGRNYSMILINNGWHLISRDQLIMIHNKVTETVNCVLIGWLLSGVCWSGDFYLKQKSLIDFMRRKVNQLHNQAYELFKTFDGLATALILKEKDTFKNDGPIQSIITNLLRSKVITQLDKLELFRIFQGATYELTELSGMSKLLGHPDIDTPAGLNKLRIRVSKPNIVSVEKVAELLGVIKMRYCETSYMKHRKWPIIDLEKTCNIGLRNCILLGLWVTHPTISKRYGSITSDDFIGFNIIQNQEFDDIPTQFPILKDTSISPTLSGLNLMGSDKRIAERERRTLLFFLETTQHWKL
jgi:hypothetical protein